ncbi:hypothetical protein Pyn_30113 [Prunus yedoensis var. nudiflora]|uniref:Uncharacterized protein n=1 Tax=Prunus yedoensis var. nudiflora TaxID=2094558 RepID=A0A314XU62_PRUYE|nr:hypothetical protein Pyn_30113 [Prunus yedoensis var. nudiflora]
MKSSAIFPRGSTVLLVILLSTICLVTEAQQCRPSGRIRGRQPPPGQCNQENDSDCCVEGKMYPTYRCSPPLSRHTKAYLTLNSFEAGEMGVVHRNVTTNTTMTATELWLCPLDGTTMEEGAITTSELMVTGAVWWPWWWMSVTLWRDVMWIMIINLHVLTTLLMPQRLFGKHWVCLEANGVA